MARKEEANNNARREGGKDNKDPQGKSTGRSSCPGFDFSSHKQKLALAVGKCNDGPLIP
jgi:hypothetical protein